MAQRVRELSAKELGRLQQMLIPSTLIVTVGALLTAVLAAIDWYVWGLNLATDPRQPRRPQPLTGLELIDLGLGRLIAANEAVLPTAAFESAQAKTDPGDGFRRVA
jgi:hypothetical protein